ncbi:hypothetical protein [Methylobacterium sp. 77]|uniref:hypothetical protein n=1 Tax=Methylobacterium sp. 77 TaxID=1101192 RepID=UPI0012DD6953|nr:hypothetical protein [Methylobacterium sp. 77]
MRSGSLVAAPVGPILGVVDPADFASADLVSEAEGALSVRDVKVVEPEGFVAPDAAAAFAASAGSGIRFAVRSMIGPSVRVDFCTVDWVLPVAAPGFGGSVLVDDGPAPAGFDPVGPELAVFGGSDLNGSDFDGSGLDRSGLGAPGLPASKLEAIGLGASVFEMSAVGAPGLAGSVLPESALPGSAFAMSGFTSPTFTSAGLDRSAGLDTSEGLGAVVTGETAGFGTSTLVG